ncbi:protein of unknown function [Thermococcus nautili]|nr:protein of unknown function [Thermococcus nautili]
MQLHSEDVTVYGSIFLSILFESYCNTRSGGFKQNGGTRLSILFESYCNMPARHSFLF